MFALSTRTLAPARLFSSTVALMMPVKGKVISWIAGRGFGFIEDEVDKKQHFVHFSGVKVEPGGFKALTVGQEVEFDLVQQDGRTKADNVTAPGGAPLPSGPRPPPQAGGGGRGFGRGGGRGFGRGGRGRGGGGYGGNDQGGDDF